MIAVLERQTVVLEAILTALKDGMPSRELEAPIGVSPEYLPVKTVNLQDLPVKRVSKKLQAALDWLRDNPGNLDVPSRELEAPIGVSHMTIYKAQQIMKENTQS